MSDSQSTADRAAPETRKPEHNASGRFAKGNRGGPGNPFGRKLAQFRQSLLSTVTDEDIQRVGKLLLEMALAGDLAAMKLLLQYAVGKPQVVAEPDRVDIDEWELTRQCVVGEAGVDETFAGMPITVGIATLPALAEVREKQFVDMMKHPEKYKTEPDDDFTPEELAEEAAMMQEYRVAHAAEQEAAQRHAEAPFVGRVSDPSEPGRASIPKGSDGSETRPTADRGSAARRTPARSPAAAGTRRPSAPQPLEQKEDAPVVATASGAGRPSPNVTNGGSRRRSPAEGAAPNRRPRTAG